MIGSEYYNGSCIYFSKISERLSWISAEKFCRKLPLNMSLLVIENDHHMEFLRKQLLKIKQIESSQDQISFMVGLYIKQGISFFVLFKVFS